jgi:hypothetical protein
MRRSAETPLRGLGVRGAKGEAVALMPIAAGQGVRGPSHCSRTKMSAMAFKFLKLTFAKNAFAIWLIAALSFGAFIATDLTWGGSALNGKAEAGRYYLRDNGPFQEVGRGQYATSAALSLIWPPALVLGVSFLMYPNLSIVFPSTPGAGKLFLCVIVFVGFVAALISIGSLFCLLKAVA